MASRCRVLKLTGVIQGHGRITRAAASSENFDCESCIPLIRFLPVEQNLASSGTETKQCDFAAICILAISARQNPKHFIVLDSVTAFYPSDMT